MLIVNHRRLVQLTLAASAALALCSGAFAEEPAAPASPKPGPEQPKRAPRPGDVQRVFVLKNVSAGSIAHILSVFPATVSESGSMRAVAVSAAPPVMATVEETIKRLDVPPPPAPNVEVTAYIIQALADPQAGASVPEVLAHVVDQLKATFRYADYRLVDTLVTRGVADGRSKLEVSAVSEADIWPKSGSFYRLHGSPTVVALRSPRTIRLENMRFSFTIPVATSENAFQWTEAAFNADLDITEGQYVIVGKSGTGRPGTALILVLSAKVVD